MWSIRSTAGVQLVLWVLIPSFGEEGWKRLILQSNCVETKYPYLDRKNICPGLRLQLTSGIFPILQHPHTSSCIVIWFTSSYIVVWFAVYISGPAVHLRKYCWSSVAAVNHAHMTSASGSVRLSTPASEVVKHTHSAECRVQAAEKTSARSLHHRRGEYHREYDADCWIVDWCRLWPREQLELSMLTGLRCPQIVTTQAIQHYNFPDIVSAHSSQRNFIRANHDHYQ